MIQFELDWDCLLDWSGLLLLPPMLTMPLSSWKLSVLSVLFGQLFPLELEEPMEHEHPDGQYNCQIQAKMLQVGVEEEAVNIQS